MKNGGIRDFQLASRIAEELELIFCSAEDSRLSELSVLSVEMLSGGSKFIVCVSAGERRFERACEPNWEMLLEKASRYLRSELAEAMDMKRSPNILFRVMPGGDLGVLES